MFFFNRTMLGVYLVIMSEALACRPMGERYQRCSRSPSHPGLEYLKIWDFVEQVVFSDQPDSFIWKWTFGWPVLGIIRLPRTLRGTNLPARRKTDMEDKGTKQMQVFLLAYGRQRHQTNASFSSSLCYMVAVWETATSQSPQSWKLCNLRPRGWNVKP